MSDSARERAYLKSSLASFLELVSADEPAPAGGSVVAMALAMAAGLCVMAGRLSATQLEDATELVQRAEQLRDRAAALTQADAAAYGEVISALRYRETDAEERLGRVAAALSEAAEVPTELAEIGADVAAIAARIAEGGKANLLGDAVTAALLAAAACEAAGTLVTINLGQQPGDDRLPRTALAVAQSAELAERARRRLGA